MIYSKLLGAGALLVAAAMPTTAHAADVVDPVPVSDVWTGPYIGVFGGYVSLEADGNFEGDEISDHGPVEGFLYGGQIGWNHQFDSAVLGIEADLALSDADGTLDAEGEEADADLDFLATVRGRAGWLFGETDSTLLFGTAGVAFAEFDLANSEGSWGNDHFGLVVGAGLEHMVTDSISIKAEYNYMMFGAEDYDDSEFQGENISFDGHVGKIGVNFHF